MHESQTAAVAVPRAELVSVLGSPSGESAPTPGPAPARRAAAAATVEHFG